jgi:hypothetical protein
VSEKPTTGVDAQSRNHLFETIRRLHAEGRTPFQRAVARAYNSPIGLGGGELLRREPLVGQG